MTAHPARFWLGLLAAFVFALWLLRKVLLPFVLGMAIGYLLDPVVDRLARRGVPRAAAAGVIVFASYAMGILVVLLLAPVVVRQMAGLQVPRGTGSLWPQSRSAKTTSWAGGKREARRVCVPCSGGPARAASWRGCGERPHGPASC